MDWFICWHQWYEKGMLLVSDLVTFSFHRSLPTYIYSRCQSAATWSQNTMIIDHLLIHALEWKTYGFSLKNLSKDRLCPFWNYSTRCTELKTLVIFNNITKHFISDLYESLHTRAHYNGQWRSLSQSLRHTWHRQWRALRGSNMSQEKPIRISVYSFRWL